jgi:outer membrane protein assembly factor BamA
LKPPSLNSDLIIYKAALKAISLVILIALRSNSYAQANKIIPDTRGNYCRIDSIVLTGNKVTKDQIILREIIFNAGDSLRRDRLDSLIIRSRENLLNTLLFNFVYLNKSYPLPDSVHVIIEVNVIERWYIWPVPILKLSDRNFNVWWETKDLSRLSYGFYVKWRNFRGRKEDLIVRFQWGYERDIAVQYLIPYLNKKKTMGMGIGAGYSSQKETAFQTVYNKQEFFKDPVGFARQDYYAFGQFIVRRNIHITHLLELRYDRQQFSDSLLQENEHYTADGASLSQYLSFMYFLKCDHRDFKSYPLKGYYFDFEVLKQGLWTFKHNTLNTFHLLATYRKFWELHPRVYFATGINGKISAGTQPYFILRGIGYNRDVVRSYEYYLVDAQHFVIFKNNIKFALIPNTVKQISFIKTEKFGKIYYALYLNVFIDGGYGIYNQDFGWETNDLQNTLLLGYGAGLDFVTYYDIVIRLEFSLNFKNETGIFLHFNAPI